MNSKKVFFVIIFFTLNLNNLHALEPDVFVQSTVNRASQILSTNISKEIDNAYEKILIKASLKLSNGNKTEAAKILGWGRNTIANKIKNI